MAATAPSAAAAAPSVAAAAAAAADEYDPLEAFMADIGQEVARQEAVKAADEGKPRKALACDDEYDPGVEYMRVSTHTHVHAEGQRRFVEDWCKGGSGSALRCANRRLLFCS